MASTLDPYTTLGVAPNATTEDIKAAYRRIAKRLHSDKNPHPGATAQMQAATEAYDLLLNRKKRREYDELRSRLSTEDDYVFTFRVTPSKRNIAALPESQVIYLLAEIFPDERAREEEQEERVANVNLTLVLDRSSSMRGQRLERVKVAAHQIIDQLGEDDILSIITFSDKAEVIVPATRVTDKPALKARVSMMMASGATAIYQGLGAGYEEVKKFYGPKLVNHIVLLTDGKTYGDEEQCVELAEKAGHEGIGISAMGLGSDWNDLFLDKIASLTGGASEYIQSSSAVVEFLNNYVRNLSQAFAERMRLSIAPDPDIELELIFKLAPHPQPAEIHDGYIQLGSLQARRPIVVLLQLQLPANMPLGFRSIARLVAEGSILRNAQQNYQVVSDISLEITDRPVTEEPPKSILNALSKLTLYRLQQRAQEALATGNFAEATKHFKNLATRFLEHGHEDLAQQAYTAALQIAQTQELSATGQKSLKYGTRSLLLGPGGISTVFLNEEL